MNAKTKKLFRFKARRMERYINGALKSRGHDFEIRLRARTMLKMPRLAKFPYYWEIHFDAPPDSDGYNALRRFINVRLAKPKGGLPILEAVAECPTCAKEVALFADPQEWTRTRRRRWKVTDYWPASGDCCGNLIVDDPFDGCSVYRLSEPAAPAAVQ